MRFKSILFDFGLQLRRCDGEKIILMTPFQVNANSILDFDYKGVK